MKPKIGIVICGVQKNRQFVTNTYIRAVSNLGGLPLLLPFVSSEQLIQEYIPLCDGFLFCGGGDISPVLFDELPAFGLGETHLSFDVFQIRLMEHLLSLQKPVLAICRGIQVLNVACGGTIYQDLRLIPGAPANHIQTSIHRQDISHKVQIVPDTLLHHLLGDSVYTNSYHHQAVHELGRDLVVSAQTGDMIIEAVEMPSHPFLIGVQWHPECMLRTSPEMRLLFSHFISCSDSASKGDRPKKSASAPLSATPNPQT